MKVVVFSLQSVKYSRVASCNNSTSSSCNENMRYSTEVQNFDNVTSTRCDDFVTFRRSFKYQRKKIQRTIS